MGDNVTFLMCWRDIRWWTRRYKTDSLTKMSSTSVTKIVVAEKTGSDKAEISISDFSRVVHNLHLLLSQMNVFKHLFNRMLCFRIQLVKADRLSQSLFWPELCCI